MIEGKATRVNPDKFTKTGKPRTGYGNDAGFQFHAMGDLEHPRYIFVARSEVDLSVLRLYDISSKKNVSFVCNYLLSERASWLHKTKENSSMMKRDVIVLNEKTILENCKFKSTSIIDGCTVYRDIV